MRTIKQFYLTMRQTIITIIICLAVLAGVNLIYAAAPGNPTTCPTGWPGCDAPINVSSVAQQKTGTLRVGGFTSDYSAYLATLGGNVGIGTTNPGATLEIKNSIGKVQLGGYSGTYFGYPATMSGTRATLDGHSDGDLLVGTLYNFSAGTVDSGMIMNAGSAYEMQIHSNKYGGGMSTNNQDITITQNWPTDTKVIYMNGSTGNVGIGMKSPAYKLDVAGTIYSSTDVCIAGGKCLSTAGGGGTSYWTLSGTNIYNTNSGNVGIGTTNPGATLEIKNSIGKVQLGGYSGTYFGYPATMSGTRATLDGHSDGDLLVGTLYNFSAGTVDSGMIMNAGSAYEMQIHSNKYGGGMSTNNQDITITQNWPTDTKVIYMNGSTGNVGIGTKSPGAKLQVYDNGKYLTIGTQGTVGGFHIGTDSTIGGPGGGIWYDSGTNIMAVTTSGSMDISTHGLPVTFQTYQGGNVGIGTTNPTSKLYVNGTITATGAKSFEIDHPTKPNYKLIHAAIEGPEIAVFYRGEARLDNGKAIVVLPDYFEALTRKEGRTVLLTNLDGGDVLWIETQNGMQVKDGKFIVTSANPNSNQRFNWEVKAVRADLPLLEVEKPK